MKAAVLERIGGPLLLEEIELRPPGEGEAIVRMEATSVCITDTMAAQGLLFVPCPAILGHAGVGVVEEVGAGVTRVRPGQRVVVAGTPECGECYWCVRQQPAWCEALIGGLIPPRYVGTRADGTEVAADNGSGPYAELANVRDVGLVAVETDLSGEVVALLGCAITSALGAVFNLAEITPGCSVAVVGCGPLGLWMIQGVRVAGAGQIIAVEPRAERRALAAQLGATNVVDPADGDPVQQVLELTAGRGVDCCLEAAGPPEAIQQAFAMTRHAGTLVPTGLTKDAFHETVSLPALEFGPGARRIHGCQYGGAHIRRDIPRFVGMLESGLIDAGPLVSKLFPLAEINDAFRAVENRELIGAVITYGG
jgi:S-(hydroxymethyl)glutathione dehydrogenase / alcohol dehydrogenase